MSTPLRDLGVTIETPQGVYHAVTDGHAIGYRFEQDDHEPAFIMLNPSGDADDGQPNVFVYTGDTGDVARDGAVHFYDIGVVPDWEDA